VTAARRWFDRSATSSPRVTRAGHELDLACGVGYGTRILADRAAARVQALGVDLSPDHRLREGAAAPARAPSSRPRRDGVRRSTGLRHDRVDRERSSTSPAPEAFVARLVRMLHSRRHPRRLRTDHAFGRRESTSPHDSASDPFRRLSLPPARRARRPRAGPPFAPAAILAGRERRRCIGCDAAAGRAPPGRADPAHRRHASTATRTATSRWPGRPGVSVRVIVSRPIRKPRVSRASRGRSHAPTSTARSSSWTTALATRPPGRRAPFRRAGPAASLQSGFSRGAQTGYKCARARRVDRRPAAPT
jgi:hypothetical protein